MDVILTQSLVVTVIGVFVAIVALVSMVFTVHGKTAAILETLGRSHRKARMPGLNIKAPWPFTHVVGLVSLQQQEISAPVDVKTSDNAFVSLPVRVQYKASNTPEGAVKAHYELEQPETQIRSYVLNSVRQIASRMDMKALYENRDALEKEVRDMLTTRFADFGFEIVNVLIDQPEPSKDVRDAFNRVIASQRLKEAAENEAEAARIKLVGAAKAEAESKKLQGEGMANMRKAVAHGLEEAMQTMRSAGLSPAEAMAFLTDTNRLDALTNAAASGNLVLMDVGGRSTIGETVAAVRAAQGKPVVVPSAA